MAQPAPPGPPAGTAVDALPAITAVPAASPLTANEGPSELKRKPSRWRRAGIVLLVLLLGGGMAGLYLQARRARNLADPQKARKHGQPIPVRTASVTRSLIDQVIGGTGRTYPSQDSTIQFGQSRDLSTYAPFGPLILQKLQVHEGDFVRVGQVLYELSVYNFPAFVKQQELALAAARAELKHVEKQVSYNKTLRELTLASAVSGLDYREQDLANREKALALFTKLLNKGRAASDLDYFNARSAYFAARFARSEAERDLKRARVALPVGALLDQSRVAKALSDVKVAEVNLAAALYDQGRFEVKSPAAGVVTFLSPTEPGPGQFINPNITILHVYGLDPVHVLMDLPQERIDDVTIGMRAEVVLDSFPKETFQGTLIRVSPQVNPQLRVVPAVIRLKNPGNRIKAGISGFVRLHRKRKALTVPSTALIQRANKAMVIRVEEGRARFREVRTGHLLANGIVEIRTGVAVGDELVIFHNFSRNAPDLAVHEGYLKDNDPVDVNWRRWARRD
jgi:RND family efflux transporter MFP subunit